MNENLNLSKILRDCPKGTKLYSTIYGEVELNEININSSEPIYILVRRGEVSCEEVSLAEDGRLYCGCGGECTLFPSKEQRDWDKFRIKKPKFDPMTLNPFDKVLVFVHGYWSGDFYSSYSKYSPFPYLCFLSCSTKIIPYNDETKHLLGTNEEAPEFYKYWED